MMMEKQAAQGEVGWQPVPGVKLLRTLRGHTGVIGRIAWSPDGKLLASPSRDGTIRIWDYNSGRLVYNLGWRSTLYYSVDWSPDGKNLVAASNDNLLRLWSINTGQRFRDLVGHTAAVFSVAWSPNGNTLASASGDSTVRLWNVNLGEAAKILHGHAGQVTSVAWSPDGNALASGSTDTTARLWDSQTGQTIRVFEGHFDWINSVAWLPNSKISQLATASDDKTIRIWDIETGETRNVLEGHTGSISCLNFSVDGNLASSKGQSVRGILGENTVCLWRCDSWTPIAIISEPSSFSSFPSIAFHPHEPLLATVGSDATARLSENIDENERDIVIHIWQFDLGILLGAKQPATVLTPIAEDIATCPDIATPQALKEPSILHTTVKIVIVGDSGVGKTGLGWLLAHGKYEKHDSSHGQQLWVINQLNERRDDGTHCEAILWDLAGQPDYRLIHALSLGDTDLALIVFDSTDSRDPLSSVEYWLRQLPPNCPKILVAGRADRGSPTLTRETLNQYCKQRGISGGIVETSAFQNRGIDELIRRMKEQIDWDSKPATTTTTTFKRIKDFALKLKEDRTDRQLIFTHEQLRAQLESIDRLWKFTDAEMITAIGHLAHHGYARRVKAADLQERILLAPELLNNLASSFVLEARRNPKGLGALEEQRVLDGSYRFVEVEELTKQDRDLLLDATVTAFLENRLTYRCFREVLGETKLLVFPDLMNLKKPILDDIPTEEDVSYTVSGANENTYPALVVLLGYTNTFQRTNQWYNQARYEFDHGQICGFRRTDDLNGDIDFVLFYSSYVSRSVKNLFQGLFESFLTRKHVTIKRFEQIKCGRCGQKFDRNLMKKRLAAGKKLAHCDECGNQLCLRPAEEPLHLTKSVRSKIERQRATAKKRLAFEQVVFQLKRFIESTERTRPKCFISYALNDKVETWNDPRVTRWVQQLGDDLQKAGMDVVLDQWANRTIGLSVPRFIERITDCDRILVVGTPLYLKKYENRDSELGTVVAAEMDLISHRMLGSEGEKASVLALLLSGNETVSLPPMLRRRVYADFRNESAYFTAVLDLTISLYGIDFNHPTVKQWQAMLQDNEKLRWQASPEEDESIDDQLRNSLPQIGREAREKAFKAGRSVMVLKEGKPIWIDPDGTERPVEPDNSPSSDEKSE